MSTMTLAPEMGVAGEDYSYALITEFEIHTELGADDADAERERTRYDAQILAALVSP